MNIILTLFSSAGTEKTIISLYEEGKRSFEMEVSILAQEEPAPCQAFGIFIDEVHNFIDDLLALEVDGRKFRTKYFVPWQNASPMAENFLWTILSNKEKKEITTDISYVKPTAQHWLNFAKEISDAKIFEFWINRAFTQAFWQFVTTVPCMQITGSSVQARCNSVLTLVYINATRIIFDKLLENEVDGLFSTTFTTALAACRNDQHMADLVRKDFSKFLPEPTELEKKMPDFNQAQPVLQILLDYLKKANLNFQRLSIQEVFKKVSNSNKL